MTDELDVGVRVVATDRVGSRDLAALGGLFEATYRDADKQYLEKSLATFRFVAIAECADDVVGFSFGDSLRCLLPRLSGPQSVALAGIACVADTMRKRGLFVRLASEAMQAGGGVDPGTRFLFVGRMAHVVTYRTMARMSPSVVPATGKALEPWHREMAVAVASLFGVEVDRETFVVRGSGTPVGFPRLAYEATPEEEALFTAVDRSRGDSLLSMCWIPDAPPDW